MVYGIVEQKISLWSNWVQDEDDEDFEARDVITHIRLWHDLTDGRTERKVMAASAGAQLHIWNIDKGEVLKWISYIACVQYFDFGKTSKS